MDTIDSEYMVEPIVTTCYPHELYSKHHQSNDRRVKLKKHQTVAFAYEIDNVVNRLQIADEIQVAQTTVTNENHEKRFA
jgi:hypothetical protein